MQNMKGLPVILIAGIMAILGYTAGSHGTMARVAAAAETASPPAQARKAQQSAPEFQIKDNSAALRKMLRKPVLTRFLSLWGTNSRGLFSNTWLGIGTIQNPFDVWITQEILYEVKPDFVVETGTFRGGSAAVWATLLEQINPEARVITVDIEDHVTTAKDLPIVQRKVDFLVGSSTDPAIVAEIAKRVEGGKVLVILDSLHTKEHVLDEMKAYSPLVDVGSYLIVQDTGMAVPAAKNFGWANLAVDEFLAGNDEFTIDHARERLVMTNNPGGFLKRVR
jgi:cephalosporin hydroxylase